MDDIRPKPDQLNQPVVPRVLPEQPKTPDTKVDTPHIGDPKEPVQPSTLLKP